MRIADLDLLRCVDCGSDLAWRHVWDGASGCVERGVVGCAVCDTRYPVLDGVGVFFRAAVQGAYLTREEAAVLQAVGASGGAPRCHPGALDATDRLQLRASANWDYQWKEVLAYDRRDCEADAHGYLGRSFFWSSTLLEPAMLEGRCVYIACVGGGREAYHVLDAHAERLLVNELSPAIYKAREFLRGRGDAVLFMRNDVAHSPLRDGVADVTICDHALHEIPDRDRAFLALVRATRPGGLLSLCVIAHEANWVLRNVVDRLKPVWGRIPLPALRAVAFVPALVTFGAAQGAARAFQLLGVAPATPLADLARYWAHNDLRTVWNSCFDLMQSPVAFTFTRQHLERLHRDNGLVIEALELTSGANWSCRARLA